MTHEEMQAELGQAGYFIKKESEDWDYRNRFRVFAPDQWEYEANIYSGVKDAHTKCKNEAIEKAYAHYQREKRYAEMEALLKEIAKEADDYCLWLFGQAPEKVNADATTLDVEITVKTIQKLKALLNE